MSINGGCRCGAVRYTLALGALPPTYACHCHQCQRGSGSAFSQQALVPDSSIVAGCLATVYERSTKDRTSRRHVRGVGRAGLANTSTRRPAFAVARAGTLDRPGELACVAHIWARREQSWMILAEGAPVWPEEPSPDEIAPLLRPRAR